MLRQRPSCGRFWPWSPSNQETKAPIPPRSDRNGLSFNPKTGPETNKAVERSPTACSVRRSGGGGEAPAWDVAVREGEGRTASSCEGEIGVDCGSSRTRRENFRVLCLRRDVAAPDTAKPG